MKTLSFDGVLGLPGVAPGRGRPLVRRCLHGQHADVFYQPPFGYALFYLKSVAPPEVSMAQIYRSSIPFLFLQATGLAICIIFRKSFCGYRVSSTVDRSSAAVLVEVPIDAIFLGISID